jgi:hypothetical protein
MDGLNLVSFCETTVLNLSDCYRIVHVPQQSATTGIVEPFVEDLTIDWRLF